MLFKKEAPNTIYIFLILIDRNAANLLNQETLFLNYDSWLNGAKDFK